MNEPAGSPRRAAAIAIVGGVAAVHLFRLGSYLRGAPHRLYHAYASDLLLPLAAYFILCLAESRQPFLRDGRVKAAVVFGAASFAETMQGLGVPLLGSTFDPVDYAMYAAGTLLAVFADRALRR
jgi:hypothetical protein